MENYIVIKGKKAELTPEQLEQLGIEAPKKSLDIDFAKGEEYQFINSNGELIDAVYIGDEFDEGTKRIGNQYKAEEIVKKALPQDEIDYTFLKIKQYVAHHIGDWKADWEDTNQKKWYVYYDYKNKQWYICSNCYARENHTYMPEWLVKNVVELLNLRGKIRR